MGVCPKGAGHHRLMLKLRRDKTTHPEVAFGSITNNSDRNGSAAAATSKLIALGSIGHLKSFQDVHTISFSATTCLRGAISLPACQIPDACMAGHTAMVEMAHW